MEERQLYQFAHLSPRVRFAFNANGGGGGGSGFPTKGASEWNLFMATPEESRCIDPDCNELAIGQGD